MLAHTLEVAATCVEELTVGGNHWLALPRGCDEWLLIIVRTLIVTVRLQIFEARWHSARVAYDFTLSLLSHNSNHRHNRAFLLAHSDEIFRQSLLTNQLRVGRRLTHLFLMDF